MSPGWSFRSQKKPYLDQRAGLEEKGTGLILTSAHASTTVSGMSIKWTRHRESTCVPEPLVFFIILSVVEGQLISY